MELIIWAGKRGRADREKALEEDIALLESTDQEEVKVKKMKMTTRVHDPSKTRKRIEAGK